MTAQLLTFPLGTPSPRQGNGPASDRYKLMDLCDEIELLADCAREAIEQNDMTTAFYAFEELRDALNTGLAK